MRSLPDKGTRRPGAYPSPIRDPIVPLDLGFWFRRVYELVRRSFTGLAALASVPMLLTALYWITLDAVRPGPADTRQRLLAAGATSSGSPVDPWTELRIDALPVLPTMVIFAVLVTVAIAFAYGGSYHLALRTANGQPTEVLSGLRAAAPRVLPFIGWGALCSLLSTIATAALLLPGMVTGSPWLKMVGPLLAAALLLTVGVTLLPTIFGVVFVEGAGIRRCIRLVRGRFLAALSRMVVTGLLYLGYVLCTEAVLRLALLPFGGTQALSRPGTTILHLVDAALGVPAMAFLVAATLVTYAELRFREDPSTTTRTLVAGLPV